MELNKSEKRKNMSFFSDNWQKSDGERIFQKNIHKMSENPNILHQNSFPNTLKHKLF